MIKEEQIGHREALIMLTIMLTGKIFLSFPRNLALLGNGAGWIIVLLAGGFSLIGLYFLHQVLKRYPEQNIVEIAQTALGKYLGLAAGLVIFLFFLLLTAVYLRQFAESFILAILPRTPISVISGVFLLLLIWAMLQGIEALSRVAILLGPYLLTALILIVAFTLPQMHLGNLSPVLGPGVGSILKFSVFEISSFAELLLLGIITPLIRKKQERYKVGLYSLVTAVLINTGVVAAVVMIFNYNAARRLMFPMFQLTRLISFGEFIQRVEAVFVFLWFFWAGIQLGGLFYGALTSFAQTFKIKDYRPLVFPLAVIVFTASLLPSSMTQAVEWSGSTYDLPLLGYFYSGMTVGLPLLLWVAVLIRQWVGGKQ